MAFSAVLLSKFGLSGKGQSRATTRRGGFAPTPPERPLRSRLFARMRKRDGSGSAALCCEADAS